MDHLANCGEVLKMRGDGGLDRISSLPDELFSYILSILTTVNAVKTSILSTRWRYMFTSTSNLSFDDQEYFGSRGRLSPTPSGNEALKTSFERFVYGVLALHRISPVQKDSLIIGRTCEYDCSHLCVWISAAILKEVRHLNLCISSLSIALPSCVFSSLALLTLEINSCNFNFRVPGLVRLPSLRTLKLTGIRFLDIDSVNGFFVGCSLVKELCLSSCYFPAKYVSVSAQALTNLTISCYGNVEINAPNLTNLSQYCLRYIGGSTVTLCGKNSCYLSRIELWYVHIGGVCTPPNVLDLVTGAHNAREIILRSKSVELLTRIEVNQIPKFSKLKSLHLGYCGPDT